MKLFLIAAAFAFFGSAISASTFRIDVTGTISSFSFQATNSSESGAFLGTFQIDDLSLYSGQSVLEDPSVGSFTFSAQTVPGFVTPISCSGMLSSMCSNAFAESLTRFSAGSISTVASLNTNTFKYEDDSAYNFSYDGMEYFSLGARVVVDIDSFDLAPVPLPASGLLLLFGLGALAMGRSKKAT